MKRRHYADIRNLIKTIQFFLLYTTCKRDPIPIPFTFFQIDIIVSVSNNNQTTFHTEQEYFKRLYQKI